MAECRDAWSDRAPLTVSPLASSCGTGPSAGARPSEPSHYLREAVKLPSNLPQTPISYASSSIDPWQTTEVSSYSVLSVAGDMRLTMGFAVQETTADRRGRPRARSRGHRAARGAERRRPDRQPRQRVGIDASVRVHTVVHGRRNVDNGHRIGDSARKRAHHHPAIEPLVPTRRGAGQFAGFVRRGVGRCDRSDLTGGRDGAGGRHQ